MLEISPLTAKATQSGISSVLRDALLELRAEGAAEVPSGIPEANAIPGTDSMDSMMEPGASTPLEPRSRAEPGEETKPGEFLIGPLQIATLGFLGILLIGIVSGGFYFAGRRHDSPEPAAKAVASTVPAAPRPLALEHPPAAKEPPPHAVAEKIPVKAGPPAKPVANKVYLQLMSIESGVADVMAAGLRQKGIPALVAPGVNERVTRLLVGPFSSAAEVTDARVRVEALGFRPFSRTFTEQDLLPPPAPPQQP